MTNSNQKILIAVAAMIVVVAGIIVYTSTMPEAEIAEGERPPRDVVSAPQEVVKAPEPAKLDLPEPTTTAPPVTTTPPPTTVAEEPAPERTPIPNRTLIGYVVDGQTRDPVKDFIVEAEWKTTIEYIDGREGFFTIEVPGYNTRNEIAISSPGYRNPAMRRLRYNPMSENPEQTFEIYPPTIVRGRAISASDETPLQGIDVLLSGFEGEGKGNKGLTNALGVFEIEGAPIEEDFVLNFSQPNADYPLSLEFSPYSKGPIDVGDVRIPESGTLTIRTVTSDTKEPVPGVVMNLEYDSFGLPNQSIRRRFEDREWYQMETDSDGEIILSGIPYPGELEYELIDSGVVGEVRWGEEEGNAFDVEIPIGGSAIAGQVFIDDEAPVRFEVNLYERNRLVAEKDSGRRNAVNPFASAQSQESGDSEGTPSNSFEFTNIDPGNYQLRVEARRVESRSPVYSVRTREDVTVAENETVTRDLYVYTRNVEGIVLNADGTARTEGRLQMAPISQEDFESDEEPSGRDRWRRIRSGASGELDERGRFSFNGIASGYYNLAFIENRGYDLVSEKIAVPEHPESVPEVILEIPIDDNTGVEITILDQATEQPIDDISRLGLIGDNRTHWVGSFERQSAGVFRMAPVPPATYRVYVSSESYGDYGSWGSDTTGNEVTVTKGQLSQKTIYLSNKASIRFIVRGKDRRQQTFLGSPDMPTVSVILENLNSFPEITSDGKTSQDSRLMTFNQLDAGDYNAQVIVNDSVYDEIPIFLQDGEDRIEQIRIDP